ncbi:MAG: RNA polymerase sigma factor [Oscillospiraceae bacterium]|nr:RNA polymerase sigma factor [Oscillospiraceae bacterium]
MEDAKIIELYFARNEDAICQTDAVYGRRLFSLADRILHNAQDSEETVSDTYLKTWETIPPKRPSYFYAYLAKICRHFALGKLDWKAAAKRKAEVVSLTAEMALCIPDQRREAEVSAREIGSAMNAFLERIPQESRVIFLRRYWFCDTIAEIAERYGISESKVKMQLHRTRTQLADFLRKEGITV